jgi:hypothetical protein
MRGTWLLLLLLGCEADTKASNTPTKPVTNGPAAKVAGVYPENFDCNTIASTDQLASVLGAPARSIEAPSVPRGLPKPCKYEVATTTPELWWFDFDCREGYKKTADALFEQYRQLNADRIQKYNEVSDAGVKPTGDAGTVEYKAPGIASEVAVGAKGLDHNDQGLIFIDDDAPCYVRVMGPDATRRLELAKHVAKSLTYVNAPMTPRALDR